MKESRMKLTFFDDYWVDFRKGTTRRWYQPQMHSIAPITIGYASVLFDPERKKYRLYYETQITEDNDHARLLKLMESDDMVHFTPVRKDDGSDVLIEGNGGIQGMSVLYDVHESDPARRYKFCSMTGMSTGRRDNHPVSLAFLLMVFTGMSIRR